ncbi:MAG: EAL domain-containing protein [Cyanobacteria bacterium P01_D01_bin.115]
MNLLQTIATAISQSPDFDAALLLLLELVCTSTRWVFGEVWLPQTAQQLDHSGLSYTTEAHLTGFDQESYRRQFARGQGLPGRVYATGQAEWLADTAQCSLTTFHRRDLAQQYGLGAGLGVPVTLDGEVLMVLVFFTSEVQACDHDHLRLVEAIAVQVSSILRLKQTEAALTAYQQQLQRVINTLPGIVFKAAGPPDWRMRWLSDGCSHLTGYPQEQLVGDNRSASYNDITHADDLCRVVRTIEQALGQGQPYQVEYRIITRNGEEKWVWEKGQTVLDDAGAIVALEGFITDITPLKQTEAALRESETRYRMLAEGSLDLISQHDLTGVFHYVSPACHNLLGYTPEELIGRSPEQFFHPQDKPRVLQHYRQFLRLKAVPTLRFRVRHRSGDYRWFETVGCMINQPSELSARQVLAVSRDVTEQVEAEQALIEREKFLSLVLDSIPQHLFWKDHKGTYLGCNQAFAQSVGLQNSAEVVGKTDYDLPSYSVEDAGYYRQQDCRIMQANWPQINTLEFKEAPLNQWINCSKFPIHDASQQVIGVLGSLEDVSDRIAFQKNLNRREQYLTALVELQRQLLDLDSSWDNARFCAALQPLALATEANRVYLYERLPDQLVQRAQWTSADTVSTYRHPSVATFELQGAIADWVAELSQKNYINQTLEQFPEPLQQILGQAPSAVKSILLLPLQVRGQFSGLIGFDNCEAARIWSQSEVNLLRVAAHAVAIATERFQAEISLRQAETKYRSIFENAVEGIFQTTPSGRYLTVNPMLAKIYGYASPQELITSLTDIGQQLYVEPGRREIFVEQMLTQGAVIGYESAVYQKDGTMIWISESARTTYDANGAVVGFEGTVEDITERKGSELKLYRRDRLLQGVAQGSQYLLTNLNIEQSIAQVLAILGEAAAADRAYLYENHCYAKTDVPCMSMRHEWMQTGIPPRLDQPHWQNQSYAEHGLMRWYRAFQAGQSIRGRVSTFPMVEQQLLSRDGIVSLVMVPIFIDHDLWGYIGFDACRQMRDWTSSEESILVTIAASIGGAFKRRHTEEQMRYQAFHDPLTGLPNRTAFNQQLPLAMATARRHETLIAVMFLDLDRFKNINDTLGHAIGDALLVQATQRLIEGLRRNDMLARWGGDEFTLILRDLSSTDEAANVAERLAEKLKPPFLIEHHELYITGSIGIAVYPNDGDTMTTLLQYADAAMYAAKGDGRNTYRFYNALLNSAASRQLVLEKHLHQALQRREFRLHFQPQIDLAAGKICRIEALARWFSPELGEVPPQDFIPIAEEIGLIVPLGEWVLEQACCQLQLWHQQGFEQLQIAVNLSARQLHSSTLVDKIEQVLSAFALVPQCLELEITETATLANLEASVVTLNQLQKLGTRIVMDDFGTGYSSLSYLKQLPFQGVKIDRSFVDGIPDDAQDVAMLKAVIALGQALNLSLVAEGVETTEQMNCLQALGCQQMQGYRFSRPLDSQAMTAFLTAHWPHYTVDSVSGLSPSS